LRLHPPNYLQSFPIRALNAGERTGAPISSKSMRPAAYIGMLAVVLVGSFVLTLWLVGKEATSPGPTDSRSYSERLASQQLSNYGDLSRLTDTLGMKRSSQMKGNVDAIRRTNDHEVMMLGWFADPDGDATPLTIAVFVSGSIAATAQTKGERPDVTQLLGLSFGAEKNVRFDVLFTCSKGHQPVVVVLGSNKMYLPLISPPCP